jgi:hypothetical protein
MSILGKVLVILNLIGVLAVAVLGAMDYGKRQAWTYAVFRAELMLRGLPLDKEKEERDTDALLILAKFHDETRKELFPQGKAVDTQREEVERLQGEVKNQIQTAGSNDKQMLVCAEVLLPFAQTNADRDRLLDIRTHLADEKAQAAYKAQLELAFRDAGTEPKAPRKEKLTFREAFEESLYLQRGEITGPFVEALFALPKFDASANFDKSYAAAVENIGTSLRKEVEDLFTAALDKKVSSEQQKQRIARLLFGLADRRGAVPQADGKAPPPGDLMENAEFKRALTVCGVKAIVTAVQDQALAVAKMIPEIETERGIDRSVFALQHGRYVERIKDAALQIDIETAQLQSRQELTTAHEQELKKRRRDVKDTEDELAEARDKTAKWMTMLRDLADKLDAERLKFRDRRQDNQRLEREIRVLEANH